MPRLAVAYKSESLCLCSYKANGGRLKSRPDIRWVFDSTSMYFRALHAIMTGRYRLSTRKFIFDLFDFQLDSGLVKQLNGMAEALIMDEQDVYDKEEEELLGRRRGHGRGVGLLSGVENGVGIGLMNGADSDEEEEVEIGEDVVSAGL